MSSHATSFAILFALSVSAAQADIIVMSSTPQEKYVYTAALAGEWTQVPALAGSQLTYALTWGTPLARTCTFKSDDNPPGWDLSSKDKAKELANSFLLALRANPEIILRNIMQRSSNLSLEDFYASYETNSVKLTVIYSFDETGVLAGQKMNVRGIAYETQYFSTGVFLQVTCSMLRNSYDVHSEQTFKHIRDSIAVRYR